MFCTNCGKMLPDGASFCPECGAAVNTKGFDEKAKEAVDDATEEIKSTYEEVKDTVNNAFNGAEKEIGNVFSDIGKAFSGKSGNESNNPSGGVEPLKTNRKLGSYIFLNIITLGLYGYYFLYRLAKDVNTACEGDGEETAGVVEFVVLSFITLGIYAIVWECKLANRLQRNAKRYNTSFNENSTDILIWQFAGAFLCGAGPYVAMYILITNTNLICWSYNRYNNVVYYY